MKGDFAIREDELAGKTAIVVGMGNIGVRLIKLLKAFEMTVIGIRANPASGAAGADEVHATSELPNLLPRADFVVLVCPLTPETTNLIDAKAFALMKPGAYLVNCARGKVVDEEAMIEALQVQPHQGRGSRRDGGGAAAAGFAALDPAQRLPRPAHRRRDLRLRGQRARHHDGKHRPAEGTAGRTW
jgi:hypothetical protein